MTAALLSRENNAGTGRHGEHKKNTPNRIPSTNYFFFFVAVAAVLLAAVTNSTITPAYDVLQFRVHTSLLFAVAVLKFVHFVYDASCAQRTCTHTHKKKSAYFVSVSKSVRQTNKTKRKKKGTAFDEKAKKNVHDAFYEVLSNVL